MRRLALAVCLAAPAAAQDDRPPVTVPTPEQVRVAKQLGEAHFRDRRFRPAIEQWDLVLRAFPGDTVARYQRAMCRFCLLEAEAAEADCDVVLAARPDWDAALTLRGSVRMLRSRWAGAVADFDAALARRPQPRIEAHRELAEALQAAEARLPIGGPAPGLRPPAADAPRPKLVGLDDQLVDLAAAAQGGALVLVFHPEPMLTDASTAPVVMSHLASLREHRPDLLARGATVLAVSRSTPAEIRALAEDKGLDYPLVSDTDGLLAAAYGATDLMHVHADLGNGTLLAVYVVDKAGMLRAREVFVNPGRFLDFEAFGARLSAITGVSPPAKAPPAGAAPPGSGAPVGADGGGR